MANKKIDLVELKLATIRLIKIVIPQAVLFIPYILAELKGANLPLWVVPALVFVGAFVTALDKFLREIGFYDQTPIEKFILK